MIVTSSLKKLALMYDYTIVCDDIQRATIPVDAETVKWAVELINPKEYTREELLKQYNGKIEIARWVHTYTEDSKPAVAVVIE